MIHDEVFDRLQDPYLEVPCDRRAVFLGGEPGAGKSTFIDSVTGLNDGYVVADPDVARTYLLEELVSRGLIPETDARIEGGAMPAELSGLFHQEASHINSELENWAIQNGKNIVFDNSMAKTEALNSNLDMVHEAGYDVTGILAECEPGVAIERRFSRYQQETLDPEGLGGRPVPPDFVGDVRKDAPGVFEQAQARENGFDRSIRVDTSGAEPVLIGAWQGPDPVEAITGLNQIDFTPANDQVFIPEGVPGYIKPELQNDIPAFEPDVAMINDDPNVLPSERALSDPGAYSKDSPQPSADAVDPGTEAYDIDVDYGSGETLGHDSLPSIGPDGLDGGEIIPNPVFDTFDGHGQLKPTYDQFTQPVVDPEQIIANPKPPGHGSVEPLAEGAGVLDPSTIVNPALQEDQLVQSSLGNEAQGGVVNGDFTVENVEIIPNPDPSDILGPGLESGITRNVPESVSTEIEPGSEKLEEIPAATIEDSHDIGDLKTDSESESFGIENGSLDVNTEAELEVDDDVELSDPDLSETFEPADVDIDVDSADIDLSIDDSGFDGGDVGMGDTGFSDGGIGADGGSVDVSTPAPSQGMGM